MKLTPNNFLQIIKNVVTGGGVASVNVNGTTTNQKSTLMPADAGFMLDIEYPINSLILPAAGASIQTAFTNGKAIQWTHGSTQAVVVPFIIPRDYDQTMDWLDLTIVGAKAGAGSDTPSFTVVMYVLPLGASATNAAVNPNASAYGINIPIVTFTTASTAIAHFNFQGNGLLRKQIVYFTITPSGNTTAGQELLLADSSLTYASDLVAYETFSGSDPADLAANDEIGFPLR